MISLDVMKLVMESMSDVQMTRSAGRVSEVGPDTVDELTPSVLTMTVNMSRMWKLLTPCGPPVLWTLRFVQMTQMRFLKNSITSSVKVASSVELLSEFVLVSTMLFMMQNSMVMVNSRKSTTPMAPRDEDTGGSLP